MAKLLPGWTRIPGPKKRYRDPSGNVVSYRTYRKAKLGMTIEEHAFMEAEKRRKGDMEARKRHKMGRYNALVREFRAKNPGEHVRGPKAVLFKSAIKALYVHRHDKRHDGPLAKALEILGYRGTRDSEFDVGDSPSRQ